MESAETLEIGIPDKSCGVNSCSECTSQICKKIVADKKAEAEREVGDIPKERIDELLMQPFNMHILFTNG